MTLKQRISDDMKTAMRAKEADRLLAIRNLMAAMKQREVDERIELPDAELDAMIAAAIAQTGASGPRDMGQVMQAVMAASDGRADGKRASARVREALTA